MSYRRGNGRQSANPLLKLGSDLRPAPTITRYMLKVHGLPDNDLDVAAPGSITLGRPCLVSPLDPARHNRDPGAGNQHAYPVPERNYFPGAAASSFREHDRAEFVVDHRLTNRCQGVGTNAAAVYRQCIYDESREG